jgi:acetyl esterase/lipase
MARMRAMRSRRAFEGEDHTLRVARRRQRRGDSAPTRGTRARVRVHTGSHEGIRVWTLRPRRRSPVARVVYLHGGGYLHPLTRDYWRLLRQLATAPAEVVVPAYPLAPGATVDDVVPRLASLVRSPDSTADGLPTVLMGDSAGGALALVLARRVHDPLTFPVARVVPLCPWLDVTLSQDGVAEEEPEDPVLAPSGLRAAGRVWSGSSPPEDPEVSPLHLPLDGMPPVDVYVGDRDILRPAVDELARRAEPADVRLTVHESTAMFHVWMTQRIPEGRATRRELVELVRAAGD